MSDQNLHQDIDTIRRMIESSRRDRASSGDIYVAWGVIVLLGTLLETLGMHLQWTRPWLVWLILGTLGGVYSGVVGHRRAAAAKVLTYASKVEGHAWLMCGISIIAVAFVGGATGAIPHQLITPLISLLIAVAIGVSGAVYENTALRAAGFGFAAVGIASLFLERPAPQILFAAMIVVGYILPGVAMNRSQEPEGA